MQKFKESEAEVKLLLIAISLTKLCSCRRDTARCFIENCAVTRSLQL